MTDALTSAIEAASNELPMMARRLGEPMKNHTSFKIGGPVRAMFFPENAGELARLCGILGECGAEPLIIGNGTNILANDGALDVIAVKTTGLCGIERTGEAEITAGAGAPLSRLAAAACMHGLSGLEFARGIPGTLGGAVAMNAGAYGGEMKDIVHATEAYGPKTGMRAVIGDGHGFAYRHSIFHGTGEIVLSSAMRLHKAGKETIEAKMDELDARRREKQPLELPSAGSTFKRPREGYAASLIERAGMKGYTVGGAQVSEKHAGFIVNRGGASFSDVLAVIERVREAVLKQFGVELELEVKIIKGHKG